MACNFIFPLLAQLSSVESLSHVRLFVTPWDAARQASLSITNSRSSLRLMSIESVMPSSHLILCRPFSSCPQSLPASESLPMSHKVIEPLKFKSKFKLFFFLYLNFYFYFVLLYNTVLILPYIDMNPLQVYMLSQT